MKKTGRGRILHEREALYNGNSSEARERIHNLKHKPSSPEPSVTCSRHIRFRHGIGRLSKKLPKTSYLFGFKWSRTLWPQNSLKSDEEAVVVAMVAWTLKCPSPSQEQTEQLGPKKKKRKEKDHHHKKDICIIGEAVLRRNKDCLKAVS